MKLGRQGNSDTQATEKPGRERLVQKRALTKGTSIVSLSIYVVPPYGVIPTSSSASPGGYDMTISTSFDVSPSAPVYGIPLPSSNPITSAYSIQAPSTSSAPVEYSTVPTYGILALSTSSTL